MSKLGDIREAVELGTPEWCSSGAGIRAIEDRAYLLTLVDEGQEELDRVREIGRTLAHEKRIAGEEVQRLSALVDEARELLANVAGGDCYTIPRWWADRDTWLAKVDE